MAQETPETVEDNSGMPDFPDVQEINSLLGDDFEMPGITQVSEDSAPTAEPEPIDDPETGESYIEDPESPSLSSHQNGDVEKDEKGRVFDPQLFAVDENGNPKRNKKGYFIFLRKDKRGKVDTEAPRKAEHFETALLYFDTYTETAAALLGDHWKPNNDDQRKSVARSIARYLESENAPVMSPKQEMLIKLGSYSAPRVVHVDTFDNFKLLLGRSIMGVKNFWATLTGKKAPKHDKPKEVPVAEEIPNDVNYSVHPHGQ